MIIWWHGRHMRCYKMWAMIVYRYGRGGNLRNALHNGSCISKSSLLGYMQSVYSMYILHRGMIKKKSRSPINKVNCTRTFMTDWSRLNHRAYVTVVSVSALNHDIFQFHMSVLESVNVFTTVCTRQRLWVLIGCWRCVDDKAIWWGMGELLTPSSHHKDRQETHQWQCIWKTCTLAWKIIICSRIAISINWKVHLYLWA